MSYNLNTLEYMIMKINIKQIFSKNEDKHKIYHLSEFLIEKIFLTYLVIFVLITSLQLIIEYHSEKNNVKKRPQSKYAKSELDNKQG